MMSQSIKIIPELIPVIDLLESIQVASMLVDGSRCSVEYDAMSETVNFYRYSNTRYNVFLEKKLFFYICFDEDQYLLKFYFNKYYNDFLLECFIRSIDHEYVNDNGAGLAFNDLQGIVEMINNAQTLFSLKVR